MDELSSKWVGVKVSAWMCVVCVWLYMMAWGYQWWQTYRAAVWVWECAHVHVCVRVYVCVSETCWRRGEEGCYQVTKQLSGRQRPQGMFSTPVLTCTHIYVHTQRAGERITQPQIWDRQTGKQMLRHPPHTRHHPPNMHTCTHCE